MTMVDKTNSLQIIIEPPREDAMLDPSQHSSSSMDTVADFYSPTHPRKITHDTEFDLPRIIIEPPKESSEQGDRQHVLSTTETDFYPLPESETGGFPEFQSQSDLLLSFSERGLCSKTSVVEPPTHGVGDIPRLNNDLSPSPWDLRGRRIVPPLSPLYVSFEYALSGRVDSSQAGDYSPWWSSPSHSSYASSDFGNSDDDGSTWDSTTTLYSPSSRSPSPFDPLRMSSNGQAFDGADAGIKYGSKEWGTGRPDSAYASFTDGAASLWASEGLSFMDSIHPHCRRSSISSDDGFLSPLSSPTATSFSGWSSEESFSSQQSSPRCPSPSSVELPQTPHVPTVIAPELDAQEPAHRDTSHHARSQSTHLTVPDFLQQPKHKRARSHGDFQEQARGHGSSRRRSFDSGPSLSRIDKCNSHLKESGDMAVPTLTLVTDPWVHSVTSPPTISPEPLLTLPLPLLTIVPIAHTPVCSAFIGSVLHMSPDAQVMSSPSLPSALKSSECNTPIDYYGLVAQNDPTRVPLISVSEYDVPTSLDSGESLVPSDMTEEDADSQKMVEREETPYADIGRLVDFSKELGNVEVPWLTRTCSTSFYPKSYNMFSQTHPSHFLSPTGPSSVNGILELKTLHRSFRAYALDHLLSPELIDTPTSLPNFRSCDRGGIFDFMKGFANTASSFPLITFFNLCSGGNQHPLCMPPNMLLIRDGLTDAQSLLLWMLDADSTCLSNVFRDAFPELKSPRISETPKISAISAAYTSLLCRPQHEPFISRVIFGDARHEILPRTMIRIKTNGLFVCSKSFRCFPAQRLYPATETGMGAKDRFVRRVWGLDKSVVPRTLPKQSRNYFVQEWNWGPSPLIPSSWHSTGSSGWPSIVENPAIPEASDPPWSSERPLIRAPQNKRVKQALQRPFQLHPNWTQSLTNPLHRQPVLSRKLDSQVLRRYISDLLLACQEAFSNSSNIRFEDGSTFISSKYNIQIGEPDMGGPQNRISNSSASQGLELRLQQLERENRELREREAAHAARREIQASRLKFENSQQTSWHYTPRRPDVEPEPPPMPEMQASGTNYMSSGPQNPTRRQSSHNNEYYHHDLRHTLNDDPNTIRENDLPPASDMLRLKIDELERKYLVTKKANQVLQLKNQSLERELERHRHAPSEVKVDSTDSSPPQHYEAHDVPGSQEPSYMPISSFRPQSRSSHYYRHAHIDEYRFDTEPLRNPPNSDHHPSPAAAEQHHHQPVPPVTQNVREVVQMTTGSNSPDIRDMIQNMIQEQIQEKIQEWRLGLQQAQNQARPRPHENSNDYEAPPDGDDYSIRIIGEIAMTIPLQIIYLVLFGFLPVCMLSFFYGM